MSEMKAATDKQKSRMERKKRKIKAFLNVARLNDEEEKVKKKKVEHAEECASDGTSELPHLQPESAQAKRKDGGDIGEADLATLRMEFRKRRSSSMEKPKVFLTLTNPDHEPGPKEKVEGYIPSKTPLFLLDLQHLLLYAIQGNLASYKPRWCRLLRWGQLPQVVVLDLSGLSKQHLKQHPDAMPALSQQHFDMVDMINPTQYGSSICEEVLQVPISFYRARKLSMAALGKCKLISEKQPKSQNNSSRESSERGEVATRGFSRVDLLLSTQQLVHERYPLPASPGEPQDVYKDYVYSRPSYAEVGPNSPMFAVDCEMCATDQAHNEVTSIAVINEDLEVVYTTFIKPYNKITDYLTRYSGITPKLLSNVTTRLQDVQHALRELLPPDAILCGQSLNFDLDSLKIFHPYIIDTSVIYNLEGIRYVKPGLKRLTATFLKRDIQCGPKGHNAVEDSVATMELVKLKLKHGPLFGDSVLGGALAFPKTSDGDADTDAEEEEQDGPAKSSSPSNSSSSTTAQPKEMSAAGVTPRAEATFPEVSSGSTTGSSTGSKDDRLGVFFQKPGSCYCENFFEIAKAFKRKAAVVASEAYVAGLQTIGTEDAVVHVTSDLKHSRSLCQQCLADGEDQPFLLWAQLGSPADYPVNAQADELQTAMKKLDKNVQKILKSCKEKALVVVVLSGREGDSETDNVSCLVKIM